MSTDVSANIMQRVFDVLKRSPELMTVEDLQRATRYDEKTVLTALRRLRDIPKTLTSVGQDGVWRYGIRASAQRPVDRRGGPRRRRAEEIA